MTEDQDNAGEAVAGAVRVALTAAGQLAEQAARRREADLREAERDSVARVATLQSQLAAERELALRSVRDVVQRGDAATVDEVMRAWQQARSWDDPTMGAERACLEDRVRERFGIEASSLRPGRSAREQATASALAARDFELQLGDANSRDALVGRGATQERLVVDANDEYEAAAARALAAESHPVSAVEATRIPRSRPVLRPRGSRRGQEAKIEGPSR